METTKTWYTIGLKKQDGSVEFLRYNWEKDDAYTDNIGHALLYEFVGEVPPLESEDEFVAKVLEDEDGGLTYGGIA